MTPRWLYALVLGLVCAVPAAALTGREVIDQAQVKHKFSSWHYRTVPRRYYNPLGLALRDGRFRHQLMRVAVP